MPVLIVTSLPSYLKGSGERGFQETVKMNTSECEPINSIAAETDVILSPAPATSWVTMDLNTAFSFILTTSPVHLYKGQGEVKPLICKMPAVW